MSDALQELITQLQLEAIPQKKNPTFLGQSTDIFGSGRIFGGQVLGQALTAATYTVSSDRPVHSMHAYFIRPGDTRLPILFEVETMRDGSSFSVRRVVATQHDKPIFTITCSFQKTEQGLEHAVSIPSDLPAPLDCLSEQELTKQMAEKLESTAWLNRSLKQFPIEIRPIHPEYFLAPSVYEPKSASSGT